MAQPGETKFGRAAKTIGQLTALSCHWPTGQDAAVAARKVGLGRDRSIRECSNDCIAGPFCRSQHQRRIGRRADAARSLFT
ncbi:hypothetical protein EDD53_1824 [Pacificibacter maritimus]|uniref:Uncharacterized protein n=1 Tax=Pacificibacter maritimus TaxID=762213 RepID=A0A3N4UG26_9RHOB|nr:hypothetical protein EDD53_1824 [Pacificibacter maritimus]